MKPTIQKILDNYNTNISSKNLNNAFRKVDEVKDIAGRTITNMAKNMEQTEVMLANTEQLQSLSKDF